MESRRGKKANHKLVDFKFVKNVKCIHCNALLSIQVCLLTTALSRISYSRLLQNLSWWILNISKAIQNISRDGDIQDWLRGAFQPQLSCEPVYLLQSGEPLPPAEGGPLGLSRACHWGLGQFKGGPNLWACGYRWASRLAYRFVRRLGKKCLLFMIPLNYTWLNPDK